MLPFDPTTGFHDYSFEYTPSYVAFLVDGQRMKYWDTDLPQSSMHLMLNSWFPAWLNGKRPKQNAYTYVDRIDFVARP